MPYQQHPSFCMANPDQKIWHNITFTQFLDMLESSSMVFHSGAHDRSGIEGTISKSLLQECTDDVEFATLLDLFNSNNDFGRRIKSNHFIMSWSIGDEETAKMWRYKKSHDAVLIGTTCRHLIDSITSPHVINVGEVKYFNTRQYDKKERIHQPFLYKDSFYLNQDEREVRAVMRTSGTELNPESFTNWAIRQTPSIPITVDLKMITDLYIISDDSEELMIQVQDILKLSIIQVIPQISEFDSSQIPYLD